MVEEIYIQVYSQFGPTKPFYHKGNGSMFLLHFTIKVIGQLSLYL